MDIKQRSPIHSHDNGHVYTLEIDIPCTAAMAITVSFHYKSYLTDGPWYMLIIKAINTFLWRTPEHPRSFSNGTTLFAISYDPEHRHSVISF